MRIEAVEIRPGDIVVACTDQVLAREAGERLRYDLAQRFPGHQVVVLTAGVKLSVVRPAA